MGLEGVAEPLGGVEARSVLEGTAELPEGTEPDSVLEGPLELTEGTTYPLEGPAEETGNEVGTESVLVLTGTEDEGAPSELGEGL